MAPQLRYALTFVLVSTFASAAQAAQENFAQWSALFLQGKISENWGWYTEAQTRLSDGWERGSTPDPLKVRGNRILLRPALRYLPRGDGTLQFHLGYAWTPNLSPRSSESRIWQQALLQNDGETWWWAHRFRMEQRWFETADGVAVRARYFGRLHRYLTADRKIGLTFWNELFWNLNSLRGGANAGFDQNRAFLAPNFLLTPGARLEAGYLNIYTSAAPLTPATMTHALAIFTYLEW